MSKGLRAHGSSTLTHLAGQKLVFRGSPEASEYGNQLFCLEIGDIGRHHAGGYPNSKGHLVNRLDLPYPLGGPGLPPANSITRASLWLTSRAQEADASKCPSSEVDCERALTSAASIAIALSPPAR